MRRVPRTSARAVDKEALPRGVVVLLAIAALVICAAGVRAIASILGPVFLALVLTVAVSPFGDWLRRRRCPNFVAILTCLCTVYLILIGLFVSIGYSLARLATVLPQYAGAFDQYVTDFKTFLHDQGVDAPSLHQLLGSIGSGRILHAVGYLVGSVTSIASALVLVISLALFMAADGSHFDDRMAVLRTARPNIADALTGFARGTRRYLLVSTVFGGIVAVVDAIALWTIGVPLPLLWALLAFITNYIPNIGFIIGLAPPALLALVVGGPRDLILVTVAYCVINFVLQSVVQPKFVGDAIGLSTTLTFISLIVWTWLLGPIGAVLAAPATLLVKALLIDADPDARWLNTLVTASAPEGSRGR